MRVHLSCTGEDSIVRIGSDDRCDVSDDHGAKYDRPLLRRR
jgi:hypothetical protein